MPWERSDESSCDALRDGRAENGDSCEGEYACVGASEGNGWDIAVAWCDAGTLRLVLPIPTP